jgi:uncharacterized protein (TIGR02145 family)
MKKRNSIWIYPFILFGIAIILNISCEKDDNDPPSDFVTDIDGNVYSIITIGTQTWMKENLKTTRYLNGDSIKTTSPAILNISKESSPKYQWASGGDESNVATFGRLYTWYVVTDSRKICPRGWHIPSDEEWTVLTDFLGGEAIAGSKLKETGTIHWSSLNEDATNESGFTALPGGYRDNYTSFLKFGNNGYWWSSEVYGESFSWVRGVSYNSTKVSRTFNFGMAAYSIRCIKDSTIE